MASLDNGMTKPGKKGWARLIAATGYSAKGLRAAWRHEEAFRIEALLALIFLPFAFVINQGLAHQLILIMACFIVVLAELFNTAIESVVDRISSELHPLSGQAKDIGSAGVFVSLVLFGVVWGISGWHYLRHDLQLPVFWG